MTDYPIVRFVAEAGNTAARLDLNNAAPFVTDHEGFSFGAPALEADPLSYAAPYGWRTITLTPRITGPVSAAAPAFSALSVELLRRTNWLMFKFDADSDPVWIQTYKSAPPPLDFAEIAVDDDDSEWRVNIEITADAFVRGQKVTIPEFEVTNNPLTGGITHELPEIVGDAAAPLNVNIEAYTDMYEQSWMVSTTAVEHGCTFPFDPPIAIPIADFRVVDTSVNGPLTNLMPSAQALGGQYRRTMTYLSSSWTTVLDNPTEQLIPIGNYRVFGRFRMNEDGYKGTVGIRLGGRYNTGSSGYAHAWQPERRLNPRSTTTFGWHDLGSLYLPVGARPDDPDMRGRHRFGIQLRRVAGEDPLLDLGGFMLIPIASSDAVVDSRMLKASMGKAYFTAGEKLQVNSHHKRLERHPRDLPLPNAIASGGYPQVVPGYRNLIHISGDLHALGGASVADLNRRYIIRAAYFPQYLHPVIS